VVSAQAVSFSAITNRKALNPFELLDEYFGFHTATKCNRDSSTCSFRLSRTTISFHGARRPVEWLWQTLNGKVVNICLQATYDGLETSHPRTREDERSMLKVYNQ